MVIGGKLYEFEALLSPRLADDARATAKLPGSPHA
jgi:hypothetical protein